MGNQRMSRHGFRRAAVIAVLGGLAASCSSIPDQPAPVFMKGGTPGIADAARGPAMSSSRPSAIGPHSMIARAPQERQMPDRQITVERGQSLGKLAVQYHVSKQAIIEANNLTEGIDPRGRPYYWIGPIREAGSAEPGSDVCALLDNKVSITPIYLDLTNVPVLAALRKVFE